MSDDRLTVGRPLLSRGFLCAMAGVAVTVLAWFGPWTWPAWPGLVVVDLVFAPPRSLADLPFTGRAVAVFLLLAINVAAWGALVAAVWKWSDGGPRDG
jgi:hypothetical protein